MMIPALVPVPALVPAPALALVPAPALEPALVPVLAYVQLVLAQLVLAQLVLAPRAVQWQRWLQFVASSGPARSCHCVPLRRVLSPLPMLAERLGVPINSSARSAPPDKRNLG